MSVFVKHGRWIRFIALMIPMFLVCLGMRVPDFSRPHKPKPLRRAVLEKTSARTIVQSAVKTELDPVATSQPILVSLPAEAYSPVTHPVYLPVPLLSQSPLPPRAPPVVKPLA